jgi:DNA-binding IclR family transcriptional regulator
VSNTIDQLSINSISVLLSMSPTCEVGRSLADIQEHVASHVSARNCVRELQRHGAIEEHRSTGSFHLTAKGVKLRASIQRQVRQARKAVPA